MLVHVERLKREERDWRERRERETQKNLFTLQPKLLLLLGIPIDSQLVRKS